MLTEDTLFGTMTVRETFEFYGKLTRQAGATDESERERISQAIAVRFHLICICIRLIIPLAVCV
jgi:ABC-type multidrug transport system ATPase subunit